MSAEIQPQTPIALAQWNDFYPWPVGPRGLRHIARTNPEFESAFLRVGGTHLVDPVRFWDVVRGEGSNTESVSG